MLHANGRQSTRVNKIFRLLGIFFYILDIISDVHDYLWIELHTEESSEEIGDAGAFHLTTPE